MPVLPRTHNDSLMCVRATYQGDGFMSSLTFLCVKKCPDNRIVSCETTIWAGLSEHIFNGSGSSTKVRFRKLA
ncbi:hypothetical protein GCM10009112_03640 [Marinomonas arenicola]